MLALIEIIAIALGFICLARLIDMINDCNYKRKKKSLLKDLGFSKKEIKEILNKDKDK